MRKIRIAGAVASKSGITLYLEDGSQMELAKNSHRTNEIMQEVARPLAQKKIVEIDLDNYSAHATVEKKTGGFIRFAVEKAKSFLGFRGETGGHFGAQKLKDDETIVAHVGDKKVPGMQALSAQIEHAAFSKDCKGFKTFMERLAAVIDDRGHTVQELLNFMKMADLPIADDGTIVAYKTLCWHDKVNGIFVDKHSRMVKQKIGSRVSMPLAMVDDSRRTQCSTGLHIARRSYLGSYFGDLLVIVKIAPEDVVAVPEYDPNKMRVMAYHILSQVPDGGVDLIRSNQAMTKDEACAKLLADIIAGDHVGVLEEVRIGGQRKGSFNQYDKEIEVEEKKNTPEFLGAGDNGLAAALDDEKGGGEVDIRALNQKVEEAQAERDKALKELAELKAQQKKDEYDPNICAGDECEAIIPDMDEFCEDCEPYEEEVEQIVVELPERPKTKPKKVSRKKAAAPTEKPLTAAQQKREDAYQAVVGGMSQREAAKKFKVCAKTLRKMVRERAAKAAE